MQISKKPFKVLFSLYLKDNNSFHFNGPLSSNYVLLRCFHFALKRKKMELKGAWRLRQTDYLPMQFFEIKQNSRVIDTRKNKSNRDHWAKLFSFTI